MISSNNGSSGIRKHWTSKKELDYRPKSMTVDKKIKGNVQIALLRGVMPIGRNRVPMADLRELLTDLGFDGVRTYIASGNAVFRSDELAGAEAGSPARARDRQTDRSVSGCDGAERLCLGPADRSQSLP